MTTAFASKCWAGDWYKMIVDFQNKANCCMHPFTATILAINNVEDIAAVTDALKEVAEYLLPYESLKDRILNSFNLMAEPNVYASGELTAIYGAKNYDYLCFVQGDCLTYPVGDWVSEAIAILEAEPNVMVVAPKSEVNTWHDADGYDHYMSDQAFVGRVKDLLRPDVYAVPGVDPDYPEYGGNSFEHMVGKYLKATGRTRKIINSTYVIHG